MSGESSKRSNLIDVTYSQLHSTLCGHLDGASPDQILEYLEPRKEQLRNVANPFGKPNDASRKSIESGSVTLADGVVVRVEEANKEYVLALSKKLQVDEIQALILFRSFLYNEGLPSVSEPTSLVDELLEVITPFYYSERLSLLRVLIPLFRGKENSADPAYDVAIEFLPQLLQDGRAFAQAVIDEYSRKTKEKAPDAFASNPKSTSRWAKQNFKEQLVLLELLFWVMWGYAPCDGPLVEKIFRTAYDVNLGSAQANATLLLDEESTQLQQDCAALWILICVEVLELETVGSETVELSNNPSRKDFYLSSPEALKNLHELILSQANSQYSCIYLAWTYVLSRITAAADQLKEIPSTYQPFFHSLHPQKNRSYSKDQDSPHVEMCKACLGPEVGLFNLLHSLLTQSPLFVTAVAWKAASTVTDPNAIAFRSVLKGLIMALVELVPVELIPDFEGFIDVWIALFGRSESSSVTGICSQYWQSDWHNGISRRAVFDVARSRFPVQVQPLVRLLRSMTATGFLDTDPLSVSTSTGEPQVLTEERDLCDQHVFYYFQHLTTYSQVIPISACTGPHALYERQTERYGSNNASGLTYVNTRPIKLPGGSTLPPRSQGRLLSGDGGDLMVLCWKHEHSGWKVLLEILTDHVNRRRLHGNSGGSFQDISFERRGPTTVKALRLEDIGVQIDPSGDDATITDILDLLRSLIQDNPAQAQQLMLALEEGDSVVSHTMTEAQAPDLVQLTTMVLEEALTRSGGQARYLPITHLVTSAMSVLSALLRLPAYSPRVWLYVRSTNALFGSDRGTGFASVALATERATGRYTMTLALLHLVQQLFQEASCSVLSDNPRLRQLKEEVLFRAARFIHTEIWVEHLGWKYAQLGDRFEIGRRAASFYVDILRNASPLLSDRPFVNLSQVVVDAFLFKATISTLTPVVSSVNSSGHMLRSLYASRRYGDARKLIYLLGSHLKLLRMTLNIKLQSNDVSKPSLLEQSLCARVTGGATPQDPARARLDPIDALTKYAKERNMGGLIPLESMRVLFLLGSTLSVAQPSSSTIIGHLSDPEATVASFVRIVQHPYDDLALRIAVWRFISLAVDREPALATLFVTGRFRTPMETKSWEKGKLAITDTGKPKPTSAIDIARDALTTWKALWEHNPQLLAAVFRFLHTVWQHGLEHKAILSTVAEDEEFWQQIAEVASEELSPNPPYDTENYVVTEGGRHSSNHEAVAMHCYRIMVKAHAVQIIGLDIGIHRQQRDKNKASDKPQSFLKIESRLKSREDLAESLAETTPSSYEPSLHDHLVELLAQNFKGLTLGQLQSQSPTDEREFGDNYAFSVGLLRTRLKTTQQTVDAMVDQVDSVEKMLLSVNLNLSLTHAQRTLAESWQVLLQQVAPYLRGDPNVRQNVLEICSSISYDIAKESRPGDMMATIHGTRLALLLALLELAWWSTTDSPAEIASFIELVKNLHNILLNEAQPPSASFLGTLSTPFHRTLLQVIYFCLRQCRSLSRRPKVLNAEQRLDVTSLVDPSLNLVIDALRIVFLSARSRVDLELDKDMELLVAVFEQCIHKEISSSSSLWLTRCQETDVIKASLDLYCHTDLVGLTDLPLLLKRKQPLYAPYILQFHMALVSNRAGAERLASEGVLAAYSNNFISAAASAGKIDVVLSELPAERSPAHRVYTSMIAIIAGVITALGRNTHYFEAEASGFVQLYGDQISRALSWTINEPLTFPLLEELEQVVNLFFAIAENSPPAAKPKPVVEKVLRVFTSHALLLLQQLSYAVTHPNHLASLLDAVTSEERVELEKESPIADPLKRPLIAHLVHRLFRLSSNIISTLVSISRADAVLTSSQEDWPMQQALLVPHSKVIPGEPASIGTLLELGNSTLDVLRQLSGRPAGQSLVLMTGTPVASSAASDVTLDVRQGVLTARRNLESILLYAVTQLAMWLSKPEFDMADVEMDESHGAGMDMMVLSSSMSKGDGHKEKEKERRPRPSNTLADRLRRGMTGEMAGDLQALLNKAKAMFANTEGMVGKNTVDITSILLAFLQERIMTAS